MLIETDAPFALKKQQVDEIEKELKRTILSISEIVGFDISDMILKNFTKIFCY